MTKSLYEEVAEYYGISSLELRKRICNGETLIHQYYMRKNV